MYELYVEMMKESEKTEINIATKHHYYDTFNTKFNISFHKPKKDLCDLCECYKNVSETEKGNSNKKYESHIKNKDIARNLKQEDKKRE